MRWAFSRRYSRTSATAGAGGVRRAGGRRFRDEGLAEVKFVPRQQEPEKRRAIGESRGRRSRVFPQDFQFQRLTGEALAIQFDLKRRNRDLADLGGDERNGYGVNRVQLAIRSQGRAGAGGITAGLLQTGDGRQLRQATRRDALKGECQVDAFTEDDGVAVDGSAELGGVARQLAEQTQEGGHHRKPT